MGGFSQGLDVSADETMAYVADSTGAVVVVNLASGEIIKRIQVSGSPRSVRLSADGTLAYVATSQGDAVSVIDTRTNTVVSTAAVNDTPQYIAFEPDGTAYTSNFGGSVTAVRIVATSVNVAPLALRPPAVEFRRVHVRADARYSAGRRDRRSDIGGLGGDRHRR